MPVLESRYKAPVWFRNGYVSTVYSGLFRGAKKLVQERERIMLSDGDFLDIDWSYAKTKTNELMIVLHGLEGNAQRPYMTATASLCNENNIDAVCVNFRGCSGEDNLKYRSYHSGATEDLEDVITHVLSKKKYTKLYIKGFSLGGNLTLKYLGERTDIPKEIKAAIAVSVPCYLKGSCVELHKPKNKLYAIRFLNHLKKRLRKKVIQNPDYMDFKTIKSIKTLKQFDDVYTSKAHGFANAYDYYEKSSSLQFLPFIKTPTLIINALNDSFLSAECYPVSEAEKNPNLFLEIPKHGGHVAFIDKNNVYYNETRTIEFIRNAQLRLFL